MSSFSTKGAIPPLPDVLIYLYTRAGCTSIASILTGDTRMLVGLGSECGNVLLMEALKSWLLIGRANLIWPYLYVLEPTLEKKISRAEVMDAIKD